MNENNKQRNSMHFYINNSFTHALSYITRALFLFILTTLLGPILFYSALYWWFVPTSMRLDIPLSFPSTGLKIFASICAIVMMMVARLTSETLASLLPQKLTNCLYRIIAPASSLVNFLSGLAGLYLFAPLVGVPAPPPLGVVLIFCGFTLFGWLMILRKGFAIFANVDAGKRNPYPIVNLSAFELLENDKRPPILYLRSFEKERSRATTLGRFSYIRNQYGGFYIMARRPGASGSISASFRKWISRSYKRKLFDSNRSLHDEQMIFAEYFSEFGPYIAIGRPGETFENMDLGASKLYVADETWKTEVVKFIDISAAIIIDAADSEGLSWEIGEILLRVSPEKVLLILPRNVVEYCEFCKIAAGLFPYAMPKELPCTRLIMFDRDWSPIPLDNASFILEDAVQPFVDRLGLGTSDKKSNQANSADAKSSVAD